MELLLIWNLILSRIGSGDPLGLNADARKKIPAMSIYGLRNRLGVGLKPLLQACLFAQFIRGDSIQSTMMFHICLFFYFHIFSRR